MAEKNEKEKAVNEQIRDFGQVELEHGEDRISMLTIIGEIEGQECLPAATKTTKYEHVLPKLAEVEENKNVDGLLLLLNTVGGDVESGLAIAEMVASIDKPTVSLVLGGSHSIGVPLAVFMTFGNSMGLLNFMPKVARTPVVMIVSIFGTIALGFATLLKKQQKEA